MIIIDMKRQSAKRTGRHIKTYPLCSFLCGVRPSYLRTDDPHSQPKFNTCLECPRFSKCCTRKYEVVNKVNSKANDIKTE